MPSRDVLREIIDGLFGAIFPTHFGLSDLTDEGIDYFVGHPLDATLRTLQQQVNRELKFSSTLTEADRATQSLHITREFAARLPRVRAMLETDIHAAYQGIPAAKSLEEVRFCYPESRALRIIAWPMNSTPGRAATRMYYRGIAHSATGIDIHPGTQIDESFFIKHGTGVVIGETAKIGQQVRLYQAVTLGAKGFPVGENGALVKGVERHPIVETML